MTTLDIKAERRNRLYATLAAIAFVAASLFVNAVPARANSVGISGDIGGAPSTICHATARTNYQSTNYMKIVGWYPNLGDMSAMSFSMYARSTTACGPGFARTSGISGGSSATRYFYAIGNPSQQGLPPGTFRLTSQQTAPTGCGCDTIHWTSTLYWNLTQ